MKIVFLGTPDFALPTLNALAASHHTVAAVITQPDKEGNRRKLTPPPVKVLAEQLGLPVYQFASLRKEGLDVLKSIAPDALVTAAFGQIISREILALPKFGTYNVHASLLPKYRGASPIQQCLLNNDAVTGVTIMRTEYEVDSGDVVCQQSVNILPEDNAGTLFDKLATLGAKMIVPALDAVESGSATFTPQDAGKATFCKMITKADGQIFAGDEVQKAFCKIRAYNPWPVAFVICGGKRIRLFDCAVCEGAGNGKFEIAGGKLFLRLGGGSLLVNSLQPEGGRVMFASEYIAGHKELNGSTIQ